MSHPNLGLSLTMSRAEQSVLINMFGECNDTGCAILVLATFGFGFACHIMWIVEHDPQVNEIVGRNSITCTTSIGL